MKAPPVLQEGIRRVLQLLGKRKGLEKNCALVGSRRLVPSSVCAAHLQAVPVGRLRSRAHVGQREQRRDARAEGVGVCMMTGGVVPSASESAGTHTAVPHLTVQHPQS